MHSNVLYTLSGSRSHLRMYRSRVQLLYRDGEQNQHTLNKTKMTRTRIKKNKTNKSIKHDTVALTAFFLASGSKRSKMTFAFLYVSVSITSSSWKHTAWKLLFLHEDLTVALWFKQRGAPGTNCASVVRLTVAQVLQGDNMLKIGKIVAVFWDCWNERGSQ